MSSTNLGKFIKCMEKFKKKIRKREEGCSNDLTLGQGTVSYTALTSGGTATIGDYMQLKLVDKSTGGLLTNLLS